MEHRKRLPLGSLLDYGGVILSLILLVIDRRATIEIW